MCPKNLEDLLHLIEICTSAITEPVKNAVVDRIMESSRVNYNPLCQGLAVLRGKEGYTAGTLLEYYLVAQIKYDTARLGFGEYVKHDQDFAAFIGPGGRRIELVEGLVDLMDATILLKEKAIIRLNGVAELL